jgi:hypothetical protein
MRGGNWRGKGGKPRQKFWCGAWLYVYFLFNKTAKILKTIGSWTLNIFYYLDIMDTEKMIISWASLFEAFQLAENTVVFPK